MLPDHHQHLILSKRFTQSFSTFFTPRPSLSITIFQSRPLFNLHSFFFLNSFFLPPGNIPHEQLQNMCYNLIFLCYHPTTSYSILFIFYFIYSTSVQNVFFNSFFYKNWFIYIYMCVFYSHLTFYYIRVVALCTVTLKQIPCAQTYLSIKLSLTSETFYSLIKTKHFFLKDMSTAF